MPFAFACLFRGVYGGWFRRALALKGLLWEREEVGDQLVPLRYGELVEGGGSFLRYVTAGCFTSRRLMVASVAAGRGCWG